MILQANDSQKKCVCSHTYITQNMLQAKKVTRDKCRQYIMIKRAIHQEDMIVINIYILNIWAPKYIKQLLRDLKRENALFATLFYFLNFWNYDNTFTGDLENTE